MLQKKRKRINATERKDLLLPRPKLAGFVLHDHRELCCARRHLNWASNVHSHPSSGSPSSGTT